MKTFLAIVTAAGLVSCAEQPESWSKGYAPQRPEGTVVNSPNWFQKQ